MAFRTKVCVLVAATAAFAVAQSPTLHSLNFPALGDVRHGVSFKPQGNQVGTPVWPNETESGMWTVGASGANATWNFSAVEPTGGDTVKYVAPGSTPYSNQFPSANLAEKLPDGYTFFRVGQDDFRVWGRVNGGVVMPFEAPQIIVTFPFTFMDTAVTYAKGTFTREGKTIKQSIMGRTEADAYGTLHLPGATYTRTLRVAVKSYIVDSIFVEGVFQERKHFLSWEYIWFAPDHRAWLLHVAARNSYPGNSTTVGGFYIQNPDQIKVSSPIRPHRPEMVIRSESRNSIYLDSRGRVVFHGTQVISAHPLLKIFLKP